MSNASPGPLAGTLMVQGTTSDAGKSTLVMGLCRLLRRGGVRVAPFKPQNMALNSAVAANGTEIGRAQALQAEAAGLAPHPDMNPVLLKPSTDTAAQIVIQGRVHAQMSAGAYHDFKGIAMQAVLDSYARLARAYEVVVVEGAGSPAEINLRDRDIANMGFAERVDCPVVLVGDIDRGGIFAHFVGTLDCLSASERARIAGFVINRFRGDMALLQPGIDWLEARTQKPVFGVLPYLDGLHLDAEDAIQTAQSSASDGQRLRVAVMVYPRISNHTDFDVLRAHPQVDVSFVGPGMALPACDLVILPGSKNSRADAQWLFERGFDAALARHLRYGGKLIAICGGMQMLGSAIHDPLGLEGDAGTTRGLAWLDFDTMLEPGKILRHVTGRLRIGDSPAISGYEMHMGTSRGPALQRAALDLSGRPDGVVSGDDRILGTYVHGLFDAPQACAALLAWAGLDAARGLDYAALRAASIDRVADTMAGHLDIERLFGATLRPA